MSTKSHLDHFAFPTLLPLVWPVLCECSCPGLNKLIGHWVFVDKDAVIGPLVDCCIDRPSTIRRVLEMFLDSVVSILPAIELALTDKTHAIVIALAGGLVEESGAC